MKTTIRVREDKMELSKKRARQRNGQNTLYYILLGILASSVGIALSLTVFFRIEQVQVTDNIEISEAEIATDTQNRVMPQMYTTDEIIALSGIQFGDNLFTIDTGSIEKVLLTKYPYTENVKFKRMIPSILELHLEVSEPFAYIDTVNSITVVNEEGRVLEQFVDGNMQNEMGYIVMGFGEEPFEQNTESWYRDYTCSGGIQHTSVAEMETGTLQDGVCKEGHVHTSKDSRKSLSPNNLDKLDVLKEIEEVFVEEGIVGITAIDVEDVQNINLLYDDRLLIRAGNINELDYKMQFAKEIVDTSLEEEVVGFLDVSYPSYARLREVNIFDDEYWCFGDKYRDEIINGTALNPQDVVIKEEDLLQDTVIEEQSEPNSEAEPSISESPESSSETQNQTAENSDNTFVYTD